PLASSAVPFSFSAVANKSDAGVAHSRILSPVRRPYSLSCLRASGPACGAKSKAAMAPTAAPPTKIAIDDTVDSVGLLSVLRISLIMMPSLFIDQDKSTEPVYAIVPKYVIGIPYRA